MPATSTAAAQFGGTRPNVIKPTTWASRRSFCSAQRREGSEGWLDRDPTAYLFDPREVVGAVRRGERNGKRATKRASRRRSRHVRPHYDDETYCQAVERACERAGVPKWTPGQLRHNVGTKIRQKHGLESARLILGHRSQTTTQIYAEQNMARAIEIAVEMG